MKTSTLTATFKTALVAGAATLMLSGCLTKSEETSYSSDGQSAYMTTELDQMGQAYSSSGVAKNAATELTISGEIILEPFAFNETCKCFVRKAKFTTSQGYESMRIDTVLFFDIERNAMSTFQPALVSRITHTRNVTRSKGGKEANIRFDIAIDIKTDGGLKTGVWNGTMTGSYNGQTFKSGSLSNITRTWENGRFHFPTAGTIELDRPALHFNAEFLGNEKAKFKVTNKVSKKVHALYVDANYVESEPVEVP